MHNYYLNFLMKHASTIVTVNNGVCVDFAHVPIEIQVFSVKCLFTHHSMKLLSSAFALTTGVASVHT